MKFGVGIIFQTGSYLVRLGCAAPHGVHPRLTFPRLNVFSALIYVEQYTLNLSIMLDDVPLRMWFTPNLIAARN